MATNDAPRPTLAESTRRLILLFGYWPPTDVGLEERPGILWKWRSPLTIDGYDVLAMSAEFSAAGFGGGWDKGEGPLPVSYPDTSRDFWRIVQERTPIALMSFSLDNSERGWKLEGAARNLRQADWIPDLDGALPVPGGSASDYSPHKNVGEMPGHPPDPTRRAGSMRQSNLPLASIQAAINRRFGAGQLAAFVNETGDVGSFVSEYMAYHVAWYRDDSASNQPLQRCLVAGHTHVGRAVDPTDGELAVELQLAELIKVLPPASAVVTA